MKTIGAVAAFCTFLAVATVPATASEAEGEWMEIEQSASYAPNPYGFFFRPHVSVGFASQYCGGGKGLTYSAGGRILMAAGTFRRSGIDVTYRRIEFDSPEEYLRIGIVLEQVLWKYFHMTIGTVGFVHLGESGDNPFGICSGLGYERHFDRLSFAVAYESELIFDRKLTNTGSLQLILGLGFQ